MPFDGVPLAEQAERFARLEGLGYHDAWSAETNVADAFTPLLMAADRSTSLRLGTAIVPVFTRGPALLATSAAALAAASGGRFVLGIGSSSNVIVEQWNGIPFEKPYARVRDTLAFLDLAFTGEKVDFEGETFTVRGFRLGAPAVNRPKVMVAALREGMLRLAARSSEASWRSRLAADVATNRAVRPMGPSTVSVDGESRAWNQHAYTAVGACVSPAHGLALLTRSSTIFTKRTRTLNAPSTTLDVVETTLDRDSRDVIAEALAIIDKNLGVLIQRELVSSAEMTDLLLDVRSLLAERNSN